MAQHSLGSALSGMNKPGKAPAKKLGTPKTSMWVEPATPAAPAPKPKAVIPKASKDVTPLLNAPNTYDRNSYTPDMFPARPKPTLSKA